jgi:acetyl esterase/lipase
VSSRDRVTRLVGSVSLLALVATGACTEAGQEGPPPPDDTPSAAATSPSAAPSPQPADPSAGSALALQLPGMADADVVSFLYSENLAMDLYRPATGSGPWPVVMLLHGVTQDPSPKDFGGLVGWGQALAASGVAAAVINYRPDDTLADQQGIEDVRAAVRLLREKSAELELDGSRLALLGFSAGGPSLVTAAFDPANQPVGAVAGLYPVLDTTKIGGKTDVAATLLNDVRKRRTPVLLAYGADDSVPGVNSALPVLRRSPLTERGQIRLVTHPAGGHAFDVRNPDARSRAIIQQVLTFLTGRLR